MANDIEFKIVATDNGTFKIVTVAAKGLNSELDKTAKAQARAAKESDVHNNTLAKGAMGAGSAGRDFGKLAQSINGGSGSLVGAYATLAANIFAVGAAFNALKNAAQMTQLQEGIDRMGNRMGITLSQTAYNVRDLSGGMLTLEQSFRSTAQAAAGGIKSDDIEKLAKLAKDASYALGRDMSDSMDRLTKGVLKLEPELLDELGIMTRLDQSNRKYALTLGKTVGSLTAVEKQTGFMNAVLEEGNAKLGGLSDNAAGTGIAKLGASFTDLTAGILKFVNVAAEPLAALLSASPGSMAGGALMFASTIATQLVPGLKNVTKEATEAANSAKEFAAAQAFAIEKGQKNNSLLSLLGSQYKDGSTSAISFKDKLDALNKSIVDQTEGLEAQDLSAKKRKKDTIRLDSDIAAYAKLKTATLAVAEAESLSAIADAESAASKKNLTGAIDGVKRAYQAELIALEVNNITMNAGQIAAKRLSLGLSMVAISAKTAGIAILTAMNWIGIAIAVVSMAVDAFKFLYKIMVGEEVIKAQENLNQITKQLSDRVTEYNKIQNSSSAASIKQVSSARIVTNTVMEQIDAVNALNAAMLAKPKTEGIQVESMGGGAGPMAAGVKRPDTSDTFVNAQATKKVLLDLYKTNIPEYVKAINLAAGGQKKFNEILDSNDGAKINALLSNVGDNLKNYYPVVEEFTSSIKELNASYASLITSITPTTPYDKVANSLDRTRSSLNGMFLEMQKGVLDVEKISKLFDTIDLSTLYAMGAGTASETDIKTITTLIDATAKLNDEQAKLNKLKQEGVFSVIETGKQQKVVDTAQLAVNDSAAAGLTTYTKIVSAEQVSYNLKRKASIENSANLAVAQAQLTVLNSFNSLSGEGAAAKVDAENNIKELQAQQFDIQIGIAKLEASGIQRQLDANKSKLEGIKLDEKALNILKQSTGLSATAQLAQINERLAKKGTTNEKGVFVADLPETIKGLTDVSTLLNEQITAASQLTIAHASAAAAARQAAAIRSTMDTIEIKNAKSALAEAQGKLTVSTAQAKTEEDAQTLISKRLELEDAAAGKAGDTSKAYRRLAASQEATFAGRKKVLEDKANADIAALNLEIEKGKKAKQNVDRYVELVAEANKVKATSIEMLTTEDNIALAITLQLKNTEQLAQAKLDSLNAELDITNKISAANDTIFKNNREMAKIKRDLSGVVETPTQSAALAREEAQHTYDNAKAVQGIKLALIDAEYALLKAQLLAAKDAATIRNADIETQKGKLAEGDIAGRAALDLQKTDIGSLDTILTAIPLAAAAARDASESSLKLLEAQIKASGAVRGVSGFGPKVIMGSAPIASGPNLAAQEGPLPTDALSALTGTITQAAAVPEVKDPFNTFRAALLTTQEAMVPFTNMLASLGPDGELISALNTGMFTIGDSFASLNQLMPGLQTSFSSLMTTLKKPLEEGGGFKAMFASDTFASFAEGAQQALGAVSSIIGQIGALYAASSKQKIAGIDKEIAAEQKRDGKSVESIAKIKALESKKEAMAKKAFEVNKKIMMAQAVMATAAAVIGALGSFPFGPWNIAFAAIIAGMGAAQLALIAGTSYSGGTSSVTTPAAPSTLSIGKRSDSVDLAKSNTSAGGESGFVSGSQGMGTSASNFTRAAYGTSNTGRAGFIVGEKGPELFTPSVPGSITPNDKMGQGQAINATINIQAIDSAGVEELLTNKRGHIIGMLREAANANGQKFLENVDTKKYSQGGRRL